MCLQRTRDGCWGNSCLVPAFCLGSRRKGQCGRLNLGPQMCPCPNPWNMWICYFICQKDFANVIKLKIFIWRDYTGLFRWVQCNHQCPWIRGRLREQNQSRRCHNRIRGVVMWEKGWVASRSFERQGNRFSPEVPKRSTALLAPWFETSDLQNCKRVHLCWFMWGYYICSSLLQHQQETNTTSFPCGRKALFPGTWAKWNAY